MDKERILKEAQKIAKKFSFWMVSGDIAHLYGYVYETPEIRYELEIKFDEDFPNTPPHLIYHNDIKALLGKFQPNSLINWTPNSNVVDIVYELNSVIEKALGLPEVNSEEELIPNIDDHAVSSEKEGYLTPDLDAYPPDFEYEEFLTPPNSADEIFYNSPDIETSITENSVDKFISPPKYETIDDGLPVSIEINTELSLIQQEYAYDQIGTKEAEINVYLTITLTNTFIIQIDFTDYPEKPIVTFPNEVSNILGDPYIILNILKEWDSKKPSHIIDILHELEKKLFVLKEIDVQSKKISGEYQCEKIYDSLTSLKVHILTYGFKAYFLSIDLEPYPKPPKLELSSELQEIIHIPLTDLNAYKNWKEKHSEPVEIIREISWLVDKNSRINFEIDLLKDHYKNIRYEPSTATLYVEMKGKMKTEDLTFEFQINLPNDYPMKMPDVKVINEFEIEAYEKIKNDLHTSFNDFFNEWTPFSYLVDLFNLISKKIFEVSVVSCVICHKIECPSCSKKIAGEDNCHAECPHCNRAYHNHCWEQTIKSFGKCGFCLR
ncbi:MAG: hypothetical protein ACFE9N_09120 [Promethearchaeota archaeon]